MGELLAPGRGPALRAKPWLGAASECDGLVGAHAVMTATLRGVLLETPAIEVEGFGTVSSLAVAELVSVIRISKSTSSSRLVLASSGLRALAALRVGLVMWIGLVLVSFQAVLVADAPVLLPAESLCFSLLAFFGLVGAEAGAGAAAHDDSSDK